MKTIEFHQDNPLSVKTFHDVKKVVQSFDALSGTVQYDVYMAEFPTLAHVIEFTLSDLRDLVVTVTEE